MLGVWDIAVRGSAVAATADAAMTELEPSKRRRLISIFLVGDEVLDFLSDRSSLMVYYSRTGTERGATLRVHYPEFGEEVDVDRRKFGS
jgi:hypothetical protein